MDHIVALARGGRSTKGNLAAACNNRKKQMLPTEWLLYLEKIRGEQDSLEGRFYPTIDPLCHCEELATKQSPK